MVLSSYVTPGPYFERTVRTSSKSLNGRKIARMAPILTIFGPNRSQRRNLFFEKFSNERRRHRGIVVVVIVAVVVAVVVVIGRFWVACIEGTSLLSGVHWGFHQGCNFANKKCVTSGATDYDESLMFPKKNPTKKFSKKFSKNF